MNAPIRHVVVEHRALADRSRLKPRPDAAADLLEIVGFMQHLPRDCLRDPAELLMLMRRLAGRLKAIADSGLEVVPSHRVRIPRQPFLAERPSVSSRAIAESLFRANMPGNRTLPTTVTSRKGRPVRIEIRRRMLVAAGQRDLPL